MKDIRYCLIIVKCTPRIWNANFYKKRTIFPPKDILMINIRTLSVAFYTLFHRRVGKQIALILSCGLES